jgi:hypothetical protein
MPAEQFRAGLGDVGTKRVATYNYIPPGNYSFQVTACNNDGVWNETGASLKFEVLPYFWQTAWFHSRRLATVLAASGAVWFETRRRMRRRLERPSASATSNANARASRVTSTTIWARNSRASR